MERKKNKLPFLIATMAVLAAVAMLVCIPLNQAHASTKVIQSGQSISWSNATEANGDIMTAGGTYKLSATFTMPEGYDYCQVAIAWPCDIGAELASSSIQGGTIKNRIGEVGDDRYLYDVTGKAGQVVTVSAEVKIPRACKLNSDDYVMFQAAMNDESDDKHVDMTLLHGTFTIPSPTCQAMFRMYNPNSGEHFYTASSEERTNLVNAGWKYENVGWYAPLKGEQVYRLYSGTDHHYTTSAEERNSLIKAGWKYEGEGWCSDTEKGQALYRQFNPNVNPKAKKNNSGSHNYTTSIDENDGLVKVGWRAEGIGWYGVK